MKPSAIIITSLLGIGLGLLSLSPLYTAIKNNRQFKYDSMRYITKLNDYKRQFYANNMISPSKLRASLPRHKLTEKNGLIHIEVQQNNPFKTIESIKKWTNNTTIAIQRIVIDTTNQTATYSFRKPEQAQSRTDTKRTPWPKQ